MREYKLTISGHPYTVSLLKVTDEEVVAEVNGVEHTVTIDEIKTLSPAACLPIGAPQPDIQGSPLQPSVSTSSTLEMGDGIITSPIPGHILEVYVSVGEKVLKGQRLLLLEAMKLENIIPAKRSGVVKKILVSQGDAVTHGQNMVEIE